MHNEFDKNKRVYPAPCLIKKNLPTGFNGHVYGCPCKLCVTARAASTGGKGPGQDGWESLDGVDEGPVQANKFDNALQAGLDAMNNEGPEQGRWPDGGMNNPNPRTKKPQLSLVQIADKNELNQAFNRTSIDKLAQAVEDAAEDDQNAWGDIEKVIMEGLNQLGIDENGDIKIGPGNYPDDDDEDDASYRTPEFFHNLFTKTKSPFHWMIPSTLAIGPHPIFSSHMDDLDALRAAGFKAIITLFDKNLEPKYLKGFHYMFVPTLEGYSGNLHEICRFIDVQEKLGNPVFIHSFHGKGRAASAAAAYLVHKGWLTAEEAVEWIRQHYDESAIETTAQEDAVLKFSIDK